MKKFLVKIMCRGLDLTLDMDFSFRLVWVSVVPPKIGFFCMGSFLGKSAHFGSA